MKKYFIYVDNDIGFFSTFNAKALPDIQRLLLGYEHDTAFKSLSFLCGPGREYEIEISIKKILKILQSSKEFNKEAKKCVRDFKIEETFTNLLFQLMDQMYWTYVEDENEKKADKLMELAAQQGYEL